MMIKLKNFNFNSEKFLLKIQAQRLVKTAKSAYTTLMFSFLGIPLLQFGGGLKPPNPGGSNNTWVGDLSSPTEALGSMEKIISNVLAIVTVMAGLYFIVTMILAAMDWIGAGGDSGKVQKARDRMIQGALGLTVIVLSYAIIGLVGGVLGIELLQPAKVLEGLLPVQN